MADWPSTRFTAPAPDYNSWDPDPAILIEVGGGGAPPVATTTYVMQANDSVTLALYHWPSAPSPDWAGAGYPGPNAPTNIAIASKNPS
jgi:hypothetical protein